MTTVKKFVVFEEVDGQRFTIEGFDDYHEAEKFLIKCIGMTSHKVGIALFGEDCTDKYLEDDEDEDEEVE